MKALPPQVTAATSLFFDGEVTQAERIVREELRRLRWAEEDLGRVAKGDAAKVALALRLRSETVMTVQWIAGRLQLGTPGYVNHLLHRQRKKG